MIGWLNPVSGISGDMLLAALVDLGAPLDVVTESIASTGVTGWQLAKVETSRQGLRATAVDVRIDDDVPERAAGELLAIVGRATPQPVADLAAAAVRALAEVEAVIHGVPVGEVRLHELGGVDTVVDVVGVAAALHALDVRQLWSAPLRIGTGEADGAHGRLPVPAPATLALLSGVPVVGIDADAETVTPTGAALLRAAGCRFGPMPAMTVAVAGYGAGSRDTPGRPNVLPVVLGTGLAAGDGSSGEGLAPMTLVETTVDDVTGELLGQLVDRLLEAGAADAWIASVLGKKGRPAHVVSALCHEAAALAVEETLLRETGSLGARRTSVLRRALPRRHEQRDVGGRAFGVKIGPHRAKVEHDDLLAAARADSRPLREVAEQVSRALDPPARPGEAR